jgi:predicted dehydrogenase
MAMNAAEAFEMETSASGKGLVALIDHELRFLPGRIAVRERLMEGAIGTVRHAKTTFRAPHRGDPNLPFNWWSDANFGGGALGAINSHIIDSLHWFLGTTISHVSCQLHTNIKHRKDAGGVLREVTSDDEANMLLRFADSGRTSDATGMVSVSMVEGPDYLHRMEFYGENGVIRVGHDGAAFIAMRGETDWTPIETNLGEPIPGVLDTGFARAFWFFAPVIIDAVRRGAAEVEGAATFHDGVIIQNVIDASRRSHAEGHTVTLN